MLVLKLCYKNGSKVFIFNRRDMASGIQPPRSTQIWYLVLPISVKILKLIRLESLLPYTFFPPSFFLVSGFRFPLSSCTERQTQVDSIILIKNID